MRKVYISLITIVLFSALPGGAFSQKSFFAPVGAGELSNVPGKQSITPIEFEGVSLNNTEMKNFLWSLPAEKDIIYTRNSTPVLVLPMPDGSHARFHVWESSIQEPGLEAKFPDCIQHQLYSFASHDFCARRRCVHMTMLASLVAELADVQLQSIDSGGSQL